jgi:ATPase, YjeE family
MHSISEIIIKSEIDMKRLGYYLANLFKCQDVVTFSGDLGVGKTFLCKSIIKTLTNIEEITSPTFNLVQTYPFKDEVEIWHCDFYRIESFNEIEEIGVFEDLKKKLFFLNGQNLIKKFLDLIL